MPLGFSGGANLIAMGERYGDKLARGIEQGGAIIEQALQRVTTQRQLEGLGQTMSQLDPNTPDYTQKLMEIAPQFPFAMQDPRGQAIFSMGVQAHKQWAQGEQVKTQFANQQTMQGIRQRDALALVQARNEGRDQGVDLSGLNVPQRLAPQNPAAGIMSGGMSVPVEAAQDTAAPDETGQLMGMSGGLDSISERALRPLAETQGITGIKPTRTQIFGALSGERTREQQDKRATEASKIAEEKAAVKLAADEKKAADKEAADEKKFQQANNVQKRLILDSQLDTITREVSQHRTALNAHLRKDGKKNDAFYAQKAELEGILQEAGERQKKITERLDDIGKEEKTLTKEQAAELLKEAGGDKEAARILARERGFSF